jgi:hypothetical protein
VNGIVGNGAFTVLCYYIVSGITTSSLLKQDRAVHICIICVKYYNVVLVNTNGIYIVSGISLLKTKKRIYAQFVLSIMLFWSTPTSYIMFL